MTGFTPSLTFTHEQARRLQAHLQTYRRYALASFLPCTGRNTTLRLLQAIQGKLLMVLDQPEQPAAPVPCLLTVEERTVLQAIISALLVLYAQQPANAGRDASLVDLTALRAIIASLACGHEQKR